jgi:hypothetical protein
LLLGLMLGELGVYSKRPLLGGPLLRVVPLDRLEQNQAAGNRRDSKGDRADSRGASKAALNSVRASNGATREQEVEIAGNLRGVGGTPLRLRSAQAGENLIQLEKFLAVGP